MPNSEVCGPDRLTIFKYSDARALFLDFIGYDTQQPEGLTKRSVMQLGRLHTWLCTVNYCSSESDKRGGR